MKRNYYFLLLMLGFSVWACSETYTPKPEGYPRIKFPEKSYEAYNNSNCPFVFDIPTYSKIIRDSLYFEEQVSTPCWLNLQFDQLNGTVHLSYKNINNRLDLMQLLEDNHKLTYKHGSRADFIDERIIQTNNVSGMWYDVGGDAASSVQFFLTDSVQHFIRGALYFNAPSNSDSLAPAINFLKEDITHLIETFDWK